MHLLTLDLRLLVSALILILVEILNRCGDLRSLVELFRALDEGLSNVDVGHVCDVDRVVSRCYLIILLVLLLDCLLSLVLLRALISLVEYLLQLSLELLVGILLLLLGLCHCGVVK